MTDPSQPSPPAGWYPDGQGDERWWDGSQWTEHARPAAPAAPAAGAAGPADQTTHVAPQQAAGQPYVPPAAPPAAPAAAQPYAPPYSQPSSSPGRPGGAGPNRKLVIALAGGGGALLLLILMSVVLVKVAGGSGPEDVAKAYLEAQFESDYERFCELTAADEQESLLDGAGADDCGEFGEERRDEERDLFEDSFDYDYDDIERNFDYEVEVVGVRERGDRRAVVKVKEMTRYNADDDFLDEVLAGKDSATERRSMTLVKEDGDWKVEDPYAG